jgi:hypothetical protein
VAPPLSASQSQLGQQPERPLLPPVASSPQHNAAEALPPLPPTRSAAQEAAMLARCQQVFTRLRRGTPVNDDDLGFFDRWCQVR